MFTDSLCRSDCENRPHRGWTTLASFAAQAMEVGLLPLKMLTGHFVSARAADCACADPGSANSSRTHR